MGGSIMGSSTVFSLRGKDVNKSNAHYVSATADT